MTKSPSPSAMSWRWIASTALAPAVWGTTYLVTTRLLPPGHPLFAAFMRTLPPGLLAWVLSRQRPHGSWWWKSVVLGGLNMAVFFPLLFVAAERLPGGVAATLGATQPLVVACLAALVLHERPTVWRLVWGVTGVVGVGLVVLGPQAAMDPAGIAAGLGGALAMGTGVVLTKRWKRPDTGSSLALAGWQLTAAGLLLAIPALVVEHPPHTITARGWAGYGWLGLVGALASYALWFAGVRRLPVTPTALLGLLSPLVATALGVLLAGEHLTATQGVGFVIALAAMVCGQLPSPTTRKARS